MCASVGRGQAQGVGWDCGKSVEQGVQLCQRRKSSRGDPREKQRRRVSWNLAP